MNFSYPQNQKSAVKDNDSCPDYSQVGIVTDIKNILKKAILIQFGIADPIV